MPDEAVELDEGARIEELDEPLACEQLPLLALALDRLVGAGVLRFVAQLLELIELRLCRVGARVVGRRHRVKPNQARSSSMARAAQSGARHVTGPKRSRSERPSVGHAAFGLALSSDRADPGRPREVARGRS